MKTAILAVYHHMIKYDNLSLNEQHIHLNTWCKYWQAKLRNTCKYIEITRIPAVFKVETPLKLTTNSNFENHIIWMQNLS